VEHQDDLFERLTCSDDRCRRVLAHDWRTTGAPGSPGGLRRLATGAAGRPRAPGPHGLLGSRRRRTPRPGLRSA